MAQSLGDFSVQQFETLAYTRQTAKFEQLFVNLLTSLDTGGCIEARITKKSGVDLTVPGIFPIKPDDTLDVKIGWASRVCAAITAYLSNPDFFPSSEMSVRLLAYKPILSNLFYVSAYDNMDHILINRGLANDQLKLDLKSESDIQMLMICYVFNSRVQVDFELMASAHATWSRYFIVGLLYGHRHSYNDRVEANYHRLMETSEKTIANLELEPTLIQMLASPWMLCSYADYPNRYSLKRAINTAVTRWVKRQLTPTLKRKLQSNIDRQGPVKTVCVLSEQYKSHHAMYRVYRPAIAALKEKYRVVLVSEKESYDDTSKQDFDKVINIKPDNSFADSVSLILAEKPDAIYYPSLGMAKWTLPMLNLRLAKYQLMGYGHPASAFSENIDLGVNSGFPQGFDYQQFLQEPFLLTKGGKFMSRHPQFEPVQEGPLEDHVVRIAINSSFPKIGRRFFNMLKSLAEVSAVPLELHFFAISNRDTEIVAFEKSVARRLKTPFIVHRPADYMTYMRRLAKCNLAVSTYPFGGTNTNIDLLLVGVPKIMYTEQVDLSSYTDKAVFSKFDWPDMLVAETEGELLSKLVYLTHDHQERQKLRNYILSLDVEGVFFEDKKDRKDYSLITGIEHLQSQS